VCSCLRVVRTHSLAHNVDCSRLQRMVQDIATSKDINAGFKGWLDTNSESLDRACSTLLLVRVIVARS
jgi:hypothetical protein